MSTSVQSCPPVGRGWPLERLPFAMVGTGSLASAPPSAFASRRVLPLTAFVGATQMADVAVGKCPVPVVLQQACGVRRRVAS